MTEPSVQVPVSLLRDVLAQLRRQGASVPIRMAVEDVLQPTPTAEPCSCPPPATHLGEGPDQDCPRHGDRVRLAPSSIADMAPGTTFTAEFHGEQDRFFRCKDSLARAGRYLVAMDAIDPSTIRDVTPPAGV